MVNQTQLCNVEDFLDKSRDRDYRMSMLERYATAVRRAYEHKEDQTQDDGATSILEFERNLEEFKGDENKPGLDLAMRVLGEAEVHGVNEVYIKRLERFVEEYSEGNSLSEIPCDPGYSILYHVFPSSSFNLYLVSKDRKKLDEVFSDIEFAANSGSLTGSPMKKGGWQGYIGETRFNFKGQGDYFILDKEPDYVNLENLNESIYLWNKDMEAQIPLFREGVTSHMVFHNINSLQGVHEVLKRRETSFIFSYKGLLDNILAYHINRRD